MSEIRWDRLPEKKRAAMEKKLRKAATEAGRTDYSRPARTGIVTKGKFLACRMIQKSAGKARPESVDYCYWKDNGWTGSARPWKGT